MAEMGYKTCGPKQFQHAGKRPKLIRPVAGIYTRPIFTYDASPEIGWLFICGMNLLPLCGECVYNKKQTEADYEILLEHAESQGYGSFAAFLPRRPGAQT
jgi:hypothetical protein